MIQDKIIGAISSLGSVGQALTYAEARKEFKANEEERKKIEAAEADKAKEFKDIQENLKGVRNKITSELEQITKDEKGKFVYPESLKKDMPNPNWTTNKLEMYKNQFSDPKRATAALKRLEDYSLLIQQQRKFFKGDTEMLSRLESNTIRNYRKSELESIVGPSRTKKTKKVEGGK